MRGGIELELVVGCDVAGSVLGIRYGTVLQRRYKNTVAATLSTLLYFRDASLLGDLGDGDLELAVEAACAASRCGAGGG